MGTGLVSDSITTVIVAGRSPKNLRCAAETGFTLNQALDLLNISKCALIADPQLVPARHSVVAVSIDRVAAEPKSSSFRSLLLPKVRYATLGWRYCR
jgi:hypothetical protein